MRSLLPGARYAARDAVLTCTLVQALLLASTLNASDETRDRAFKLEDLSLYFESMVASKYMWRGLSIVNEAVHQPFVSAPYKGLSLGVWGNQALPNVNKHQSRFTEFDYSIDYSWSWQKADFVVGFVNYRFPNEGLDQNSEAYASVGLQLPLRPKIKMYRELRTAWGTYVKLSLGHTFEALWKPTPRTSMGVDLSGHLGWGSRRHNRAQYGVRRPAFTDTQTSLGVPVKLGKTWSLTPAVHLSRILDNRLRRSVDRETNWWASITLSASF